MSQPVSSNPEVAAHYATQAGLAAKLAGTLGRLTLPNWTDDGALRQYLGSVSAVTREFSSASISLSADYYEAMREQADVSGRFTPPVNEPWTTDSVEAYLKASTDRLLKTLDDPAAALEAQIESEASRIMLNAGRYELIGATHADEKARGWVRVARPGACAFCRLLATRKPYKSEQGATFKAHTRFNGKGGDCRCVVEPVFGAYEPTAQARADASLYSEVTDGLSGKDKLNAFRRAVERPSD